MPESGNLPGFLLEWEPMELEYVPLQVALLTMEVANLRASVFALQADLQVLIDEREERRR
jgi:hypothetical protein